MWCAACQLDAPALAVPEEPGVIRCAYCRCKLAGKADQESGISGPGSAVSGQEAEDLGPESGDVKAGHAEAGESLPLLAYVPPPPIDDVAADVELRRVERLVAILRQSQECVDPVRIADCGLRLGEPTTCTNPPSALPHPPSAAGGLAPWTFLTLGLMAFVCGGVLVGWSFAADRHDLWSLGLPLTLAGQAGLVLGLLLHLDGLSQSTRRTEQTLTDLGGRLGELREVTALVSATHSAPAHSFYAHLTEGASPQILLADLKGQLDLLAQQMARQRKAA